MDHDRGLKSRIDEAFFAIKDLRPDQREDLRRMWRHTRELWTFMDLEMVNCRKVNKLTPKYQELQRDCWESLTNLESYISWAHLLG